MHQLDLFWTPYEALCKRGIILQQGLWGVVPDMFRSSWCHVDLFCILLGPGVGGHHDP